MAFLTVADGRQLHYEVCGRLERESTVLVAHHGTPGAALDWPGILEGADAAGWAVVALSRPGYAGSGRTAGRRVVDVAGDVEAVLDHLGVRSFACIGWSGGGPHALATAASLKDRCVGVATLAGVAPWGADGLDWFAGMGPENVEEFGVAVSGEVETLHSALEVAKDAMLGAGAGGIIDVIGGLLSEPDREVMDGGGVGPWLFENLRAGVSGGVDGWCDDDVAFVAPWGFDLADLAGVPVGIWYGTDDLMVPPAHGAWLAEHIPGAQSKRRDGEGHISLLARHASPIVSGLAAAAAG